jgi:hypothetical protein
MQKEQRLDGLDGGESLLGKYLQMLANLVIGTRVEGEVVLVLDVGDGDGVAEESQSFQVLVGLAVLFGDVVCEHLTVFYPIIEDSKLPTSTEGCQIANSPTDPSERVFPRKTLSLVEWVADDRDVISML